MRAPAQPGEFATALPLPSAGMSQPVHLLDRLTAVFKHRRIAGTAFVLVVTAMMVQTYSTIPMYQTSARLEIQDERSTSVGNLGVNDPTWWQESEPYYKTQYQILRSRELAFRVVKTLDLQNNPNFNGHAPQPRDPITLIRQARASASSWVRGLVAKPVQTAPPAAPDEASRESGLAAAFLGGVDVRPLAGTRIVDVYYTHTDPEFAAQAANALSDEYTQHNLDMRLQNTTQMLTWVNENLQKATDSVKASEEALAQYRLEHNAQSLDDKQNLLGVSRLNYLNDAASKAHAERVTKESAYNQVKDANPASDVTDNFALIGTASGVLQARSDLAALQQQHVALAQRHGPDMQDMKDLEQKIVTATQALTNERKKLIEGAKNAYETALVQDRSSGASLEQAKADSTTLESKSGDYRLLQRNLEIQNDVFKSLLTQQKQLAVVANSRANNVRVMDRAEAQRGPISPNPRRDWMTAILAGLTIAFGLAFGIEYLDDTVKTPEDVTRRLKLPLLGLVPAVRGDQVPVLNETVPHDFGEAFRSLRTSLVFTSGGDTTRIIAVTSTQPLEGKTTTACNLAMALALGGSRVLLIDADMRRPGLHKTMGLQNKVGLSHLLVGQSRVRDVVQRTTEPNLFVITAGRTPPNPSELLASERMNHLVANLARGPFDWIVIDTPPVLAVTDAVIIAQKVGAVVFVIGAEMTRRAHADRALEILQAGRVRSIGAVLNRVDFDRNKYYYSRYYGYQYKSYYGQSNVA